MDVCPVVIAKSIKTIPSIDLNHVIAKSNKTIPSIHLNHVIAKLFLSKLQTLAAGLWTWLLECGEWKSVDRMHCSIVECENQCALYVS